MPGLELPKEEIKKELTNVLKRLKLVGNMDGVLHIHLGAGSVCKLVREEHFK